MFSTQVVRNDRRKARKRDLVAAHGLALSVAVDLQGDLRPEGERDMAEGEEMSVNDCPTCRNPTYMGEPLLTQSKAAEAQRLALDLRNKATNIDGWCSSCQQIGPSSHA